MPRTNLNDLVAFLAVARERSFTRAAAQLGVSQSALSQTVRGLEARLGLRLLTRTTRSVAPTEAGERLLRAVGPRLDEIDAELAALSELREKPAGTIRITAHRARGRRGPLARPGAAPAGLPGHQGRDRHRLRPDRHRRRALRRRRAPRREVAKDMIAVRIGPDMRMAVVGAPSYFAKRPQPQTPQDLTAHACINLRLPTHGGLYAWEFEKDGRELRVRVEGQLVFNGTALMLDAALAGLRPGVPARGAGAGAPRRRAARPGARRLVSALLGLPPLLPEPPPAHAGLRPAGRCAALPGLRRAPTPPVSTRRRGWSGVRSGPRGRRRGLSPARPPASARRA